MKYALLAGLYAILESTQKRLEKTHELSLWLKKVPDKQVGQVVLLLQGRVFPSYDSRNIGIADKSVLKALETASGVNAAKLTALWKKTGDLGESAQQILATRKQRSLAAQELTVDKVFTTIQKLAGMQGQGTVDAKTKLIAELLTQATPEEAKYIMRTLLEDLRIGLGEGTLRDALVWAYLGASLTINYDPEKKDITLSEDEREKYNAAVAKVQEAIDISNDFSVVATTLRTHGLTKLGDISLTPGHPVKVMLAQKVKTIAEGFETVGLPCRMEYKYDGFRMEIHGWHEGKERRIRLFTRRLEDVTAQFPDVVAAVAAHVKADSFILDSEAVGFDAKDGKYMPFQEISQRIRRKYDIGKLAEELPVEVNVFDVLYLDGKSMIGEPFSRRRAALEKAIVPKKRLIVPSTSREIATEREAERFYKESLDAGNEGVMLKSNASAYKCGSRVGFMVKLKPVLDPLDLVIVGAEWGEGKRSAWLASFVLACRDEDSGELVEIGRVGTGIKELEQEEGAKSDASGADAVSFLQLTTMLKPLITGEHGKEVTVKPRVIVEVKFEEIQRSPSYSSGYALRFPRFIRLREDKDDCSTLEQVRRIFEEQ